MLRRYFILSTRILESWLAGRGRARCWKWEVVAGVLTGFSTSLISISLIGILQQVSFPQNHCSQDTPTGFVCSPLKADLFVCSILLLYGLVGHPVWEKARPPRYFQSTLIRDRTHFPKTASRCGNWIQLSFGTII